MLREGNVALIAWPSDNPDAAKSTNSRHGKAERPAKYVALQELEQDLHGQLAVCGHAPGEERHGEEG